MKSFISTAPKKALQGVMGVRYEGAKQKRAALLFWGNLQFAISSLPRPFDRKTFFKISIFPLK